MHVSRRVVILLMAVLAAACSFRSRDLVSYHSFDYPAPVEVHPGRADGVLMVYRFLLDPAVESEFLVVSPEQGKTEPVTYQRWSQNPGDMITDLIQRDLENAALFEKTVGQFSDERYRYALEGKITDLRGITSGEKARALIEVKTGLIDFGAPLGGRKTLLERVYRIEAPCSDSTPQAIASGLSMAVKELSKRLRSDIRSALGKAERGPREVEPPPADGASMRQ
jgi:ABC-type uncharacterized transport system auxiliary subunit